MQLVERHIIKSSHPYYREADRLSFMAKNLYNCANYLYRQNFFTGVATSAIDVYHQLKTTHEYKAMPAKVSQNVLRLVLRNWTSYIGLQKAYDLAPEKFKGKPKIPSYKGTVSKNREDGRSVVTYNSQAISKKSLKKHIAHPSGTNIYVTTKATSIDEIRIVPRRGYYVIEIVSTRSESKGLSNNRVAAIDLGLNNLATLTYNVASLQPVIYDGRAIKAANQYANKKNAHLRSQLAPHTRSTKRLEKIWLKRNCKVDYYLHTTSRAIINNLVKNKIATLVIGWNKNFKDSLNLGRVTNQKFSSIPHQRLIQQLQYKGTLAGIKVVLIQEAYTSLCSALDNEPICEHSHYLGKRVHRGLFRTAKGRKINADVNGSLNIGRLYEQVVGKGILPNLIEGVVVHPVRVKPYKAS